MSTPEPGDTAERPAVSDTPSTRARIEARGVVPFRASEVGSRPAEVEVSGVAVGALPNRYEVRDRDGRRVLLCEEAPGVEVSIDRAYGFSEAEARKLGPRVILLDGAGQFTPMVDDGDHLYNLDHHEGCLRAFTLATCEQALIVVLKRLELDKGDWMILANEPDLDTVFAIWVLLNYRRVRELTAEQRDVILPLLRLEGAIDANGFDIAEHCGLPQQRLAAEKQRLDVLHRVELERKRSGEWADGDLTRYTLDMLLEIDRLVYKAADFSDYTSVGEVYGHVDVGDDRVAVICRDSAGIYEVEKRLMKVWGDRLGIIALEKGESEVTLRRTASLAGIDLEDAYGKLNLLDPAVDGRPAKKRWGGSDDIGGSPRPGGTGLRPLEIAKILKLTYKRMSPFQHLQRFVTAGLWALALAVGAMVAVFSWRLLMARTAVGTESVRGATELAIAAACIGLGAFFLTRRLSRGWTWLFGWRWPAGEDWLALVPLVLLGQVAGGAWVPGTLALDAESVATVAGSVVLAALALELCFRGLIHGLLILDSRVQTVRGRWLVSWPTLASALLYAGTSLAVAKIWVDNTPVWVELAPRWAQLGLAALLVGVAQGMIRERSLSIWPGVVAAVAGGFLRLGLRVWMGI